MPKDTLFPIPLLMDTGFLNVDLDTPSQKAPVSSRGSNVSRFEMNSGVGQKHFDRRLLFVECIPTDAAFCLYPHTQGHPLYARDSRTRYDFYVSDLLC